MDSNFYGESSKGCSSAEIDINPPKLKKARFLWEVKGNYHLKQGTSKTNSSGNTIKNKVQSDSENNSAHTSSYNVIKRNLENLQNHCCVQSFLERTEEIIDADNDKSFDPCCVHEENDKTDDIHFLKWHTKQMIRYDIENKINAALEACLGDVPNKYVDLDISDIVEDVESDMDVKDEGILMAIESHGLKTNGYIHKKPLQDFCHTYNVCEPPLSSASNLHKSEICSTDSSECNCDDSSLQSDVPNNYEINSKFWNTAVSAAIYEKGLTYSE